MSKTVLSQDQNDLATRITELADLLPQVWSRQSSGFPLQWSERNPSCGQCYPTARLFQVLFGGEVIHQRLRFADGVYDHFVNELFGVRYDLSAEQMAGESFEVVEENLWTEEDCRLFEYFPHIKRMVDTLFRDYSRMSGNHVAAR